MVINCEIGGDCNGGDPAKVFEYMHTDGIPDGTCLQYTSRNLMDGHSTCQPIDICRDCSPPAPRANETLAENCYAVTTYKKYYVSEYYHV